MHGMTGAYDMTDCTTKETIQAKIDYLENMDLKYGYDNHTT